MALTASAHAWRLPAGLLLRFQADSSYPRKYSLPKVTETVQEPAKPTNPLTYHNFYDEVSAFLKE
jgi:hypothetical protein